MSEKFDHLGIEGERSIRDDGAFIREERTHPDHGVVGWARFSADRWHRYTLGRRITPDKGTRTALFIMINPSSADAFALDPTIGRCVKHARRWGYHFLEVVNLFSMRSPYPSDVEHVLEHGEQPSITAGDGEINTGHIIQRASQASIVIAGWGQHEFSLERRIAVRALLESEGIELHHLGLSKSGAPKHPLARGKASIAPNQKPIRWEVGI
jgi:hypothetical protein